MPDDVVMVTSCPLCLGSDEAQSMVTVEIDRIIPKGRIAIMICRICAGAVIRAIRHLEPPLLTPQFWIEEVKTDLHQAASLSVQVYSSDEAGEADETQAESSKLHDGEEPDDGKATD